MAATLLPDGNAVSGAGPRAAASEVFDTGGRTIVDRAHVKVERLDTRPVLFSKVFKEFEDPKGHRYDYRYWAERENYFLREFLKKQGEFTHVVQARHLISENDAAKQVLTCDAGITVADWLRVKARYADTATLSHPFQRAEAFLQLVRACLVALHELHSHRIVHCDVKEDNICIPYAVLDGGGFAVRQDFGRLKLIDFAFSVAHAIPLTQVLVIDPAERLPYQSELLIAALQADRRSGSPNAVQQLDYRVDLFSLGYMAEKIAAGGLVGAYGSEAAIRALVAQLKAYDSAPAGGALPHDGLVAIIDRMLAALPRAALPPAFEVDGEWSADEMARGRISGRQTPLTPVALPLPTPVARPVAPAPRAAVGPHWPRTGVLASFAVVALLALAYAIAMLGPAQAPRPAAVAVARSPVDTSAELLASTAPFEQRSAALRRLIALRDTGTPEEKAAATRRIAAFESGYDRVKQAVARSAWWTRDQGPQPGEAARWLEDARLLAENGDRPALLDRAFALGYGRLVAPDRVASVQAYFDVAARSGGADEASARLRAAAGRGLSAVLTAIAAHKDRQAATLLQPLLQAKAATGAAGIDYFLGLFSECVAEPADLAEARDRYRKAAADPAWKAAAGRKAQLLGVWCPAPA